ncbi:hypothetical protein C8R45DRAFT_990405 [Mycena sanguinolenta]|nr:hypothetical protein C8R45DRAFT_990405 [Mycena sanguinolenta]
MASTEPSSVSSSPAPTPDSPSPVPTPALVASPPAAAVAAVAVPGTRAGTTLTLASANTGFDHIFGNQIALARTAFEADNTPFHLLGLGVCAFLEAALGMETGLMGEAQRLLALSEAGAKKAVAESKKTGKGDGGGRFAAGLEYEILQADAVVLLGLTHALSESYMGYFQCMYALNAAHSKFTKLYKTVFPAGLDAHFSSSTSSSSPSNALSADTNSTANAKPLSHTPSLASLAPASASTSGASSRNASSLSVSTVSDEPSASPAAAPARSIFGRWGASTASLLSTRSAASAKTKPPPSPTPSSQSANQDKEKAERERPAEGAVEEMIVSGTAFGFGLFNLVFSLLPKRVQSLVGLLGFKHDRVLALRALALSAGLTVHPDGSVVATGGTDVHGVFAGLVLMTFYGVVLLLAGYQADEARTVRTYKAVVDVIEARYPTGALWILNRAKILRMTNDPEAAIATLQRGLEAPGTFVQADTLLVFELAWTLLAQRRHQEAADAFMRLTELNSWSHATYCFIAAGCYISLGNRDKAQELLDTVPDLLQRRKVGGKDLPTEVLIRKKVEFYKEKQRRRGGDPARFVECITISTADELGIFWNTYQRISDDVAKAHIAELAALTPPVAVTVPSPLLSVASDKAQSDKSPVDLDTPDEIALRALLLGIMHKTLRMYAPARALLESARSAQGVKVSTWIAGVAQFELAVTDLREADAGAAENGKALDNAAWGRLLSGAEAKLDAAQAIAAKSDIDLSSRLDSRIALLRDEIGKKRVMVGI